MKQSEIEKIDKLIHELDTAVGMMMVKALYDPVLKQAMEKVSTVSFDLGNML